MHTLSEAQKERYDRQIKLPEIGMAGQEKLLRGRVLIVGLGGLGSPAGLYLAAAGVGSIGIIDSDTVSVSNLQRQVMHSTEETGVPKVESAGRRMRALNPDVDIHRYNEQLNVENAADIIAGYDFIIDATDNFDAKFLIADACHFSKKPYSHAGICRNEGQLITVLPGATACYRCIFREPPPEGTVESSFRTGISGIVPGVIGTLQAGEAVKYMLGTGNLLTDCLLVYDFMEAAFRKVHVKRNKECPLCSEHSSIVDLQGHP